MHQDQSIPNLSDEERIREAIDMMRPEARMVAEIALSGGNLTAASTRDGYGYVLSLLSGLPPACQGIFLLALIAEGYPKDTAVTIAQILGLQ